MSNLGLKKKDIKEALHANANGEFYTGSGDKHLNFHKADSFSDEGESCKKFDIKCVNKSESKIIKIQLNNLISGVIDGCHVLKQGDIDTDLEVSGTPNNASLLAAYLEKYPTRISQIKIKVDDADQLDEPVQLVRMNVFGSKEEEIRIPSDDQDGSTNNILSATLRDLVDWDCSDKSTVVFGIRPGRRVNISIVFGASFDGEYYLNESAKAARRTVAAAVVEKAMQKAAQA
jgi:hypothetical protein